MPIRFRCVYCDQLLGIAKRKAGSVVKCPNCAGQLIVPSPSPADNESDQDLPTAAADDVVLEPARDQSDKTAHTPTPANEGPGMLFERSDFDELLKPAIERREPALVGQAQRPARKQAASAPAPSPAPAIAPAPHPPSPAFDFSGAPPAAALPQRGAKTMPPSTRSGILLTPLKLVVLSLLVMLGMALAFAGGGFLGWFLHK